MSGPSGPHAAPATEGGGQPAVSGASGRPRTVRLEPALQARRLSRPIEMAAYPGGRVFVAEQEGLVTLYGRDGAPAGTLLDIRPQVSRSGNEEGFLSLALDPGYPSRPYMYAYYSVAGGERRTRLSRFEVRSDATIAGSELVILEQPQPFSNHKGGSIRFGPDGMLYLGFGDGGSQGDPNNRAQDLGQWLGKMLRIDVGNAREGATYDVPADNPFVARQGARPEVWAYGFRNPWRASFDVATGSLWVADVGQNNIEEIDVVARGSNLGWSRFEGERCFKQPCDGAGMTGPVAFYTHNEGCSVSGGVVYRGRALPALVGWYLYADFCSGRVWALSVDGGEPVQLLGSGDGRAVASFGTDADGEVYLLIHGGAVQKIVGVEQ
jgi:glucose/arabinose dehydrogenase